MSQYESLSEEHVLVDKLTSLVTSALSPPQISLDLEAGRDAQDHGLVLHPHAYKQRYKDPLHFGPERKASGFLDPQKDEPVITNKHQLSIHSGGGTALASWNPDSSQNLCSLERQNFCTHGKEQIERN